jgi:uncharacterized protein with LGFP repeats
VRRLFTGLIALFVILGTLLVLPVYAAPGPEAEPVETAATEVALGSVDDPARAADVQEGTTEPVTGVPDTAPALTVTRTGVDEFSLVGVTWAHDPAVTDVRVQVRVQDRDGDWGEWTEVGTEDADTDPGADTGAERRGGTSPLWTGTSTGVDVEIVTRSGATPTDVQLDLIDPGTSEADTSLSNPEIQDTADAATALPDVFSRAQWGADENLRTWEPEYAAKLKAATLHHTADSNGYTADQVPQIMRSIYRYHAVSLGWGDIGYNVIVDKFGRLWEGRSGGLASTVIGAHAGGFNTGTFGVSMLGNYDTATTTQPMVNSVAAIIAWKFSLYGIDPYGQTVLTSAGGGTAKFSAGTSVTLPTIFGHRDVGSTACPGVYGYSRLGEIRGLAGGLLAKSITPEITQRYESDSALRAALGAKTGYEQAADGVTWQTYQGGALFFSPATGVKVVRGGVLDRYLRAGGPAALGAPTVEERPLPDGRGVVAEFQRAGIYWTATTNAHVVKGAIRAHWQSLGGPTGSLGYPTQSEAASPDGIGSLSVFEKGTAMWSPSTGAVVVRGGIRAVYEGSGRETGPLAYPAAVETATPDGRGSLQKFQRGVISWSPAAYGAIVFGGIGATWTGTGGPSGPLGLPTGNERSTADGVGRVQGFERGSIYYHPAIGSYPVRGAIQATWAGLGAESGPAGYPVGGEESVGDGRGSVQGFQRASVYWSAATNAQLVWGAVRSIWLASGGPSGPLGYPTAGETDTPNRNGRMQSFEHGTVYWSAATGARIVRGDIATAYDAASGPTGVLGLPKTEAVATADGAGRVQYFQGGAIYWSAAAGAHIVRGAIGTTWLAQGGPTGRLGYPTSSELATPTGAVQNFQHGSVIWTTATASATARYQ